MLTTLRRALVQRRRAPRLSSRAPTSGCPYCRTDPYYDGGPITPMSTGEAAADAAFLQRREAHRAQFPQGCGR